MIRVHIFHTGSVRVDQAIPYKEKNPIAVTGIGRSWDKKLVLPVSCYLIEHPDGLVLIDTGWDTKWATETPKKYFGMINRMSHPMIRKNEGVDSKLAALGYRPEDLKYVFISHMDFDHTSGLTLVKDAKCIMASKEEIEDSKKYFYRYQKADWEGVADIRPFEYQVTGIGPVGRSFDVFGDGAIQLVSTPGHSHGHFSVLVKSKEDDGRYIILAGDALYTRESIKKRILPGFTVDKELAKKSVDWVCDAAMDPKCVLVAPNHDPETEEQMVSL